MQVSHCKTTGKEISCRGKISKDIPDLQVAQQGDQCPLIF
jgi:hypothetical protein